MRLAAEATRYLRDRGLRRTTRKFLRTYVLSRERIYATYTRLVEAANRPLDMEGFEVRPARPDDQLDEAFPHLKAATIAAWLRPDHFFYIMRQGGKPLGYRCISTKAGPAVAGFFRLRPDHVFVINIYTRPEFRRRGLSRVAQIATARDLVARGFRTIFATESPLNYDSIISADRKRIQRRVGTLTRTCLLGWVRFTLTPPTTLSPQLVHRQLALLKQVAPTVSHVGLLFNPSSVLALNEDTSATRVAAAELGAKITFLPVREATSQARAFTEALSRARDDRVDGLIVLSDPMISAHRRSIVSLVNRHRLPTIFDASEFVPVGGLMACGSPAPCLRDFDSLLAYLDTMEAAGHPSEAEPDLVVNRRAAIALGLVVPAAFPVQRRHRWAI